MTSALISLWRKFYDQWIVLSTSRLTKVGSTANTDIEKNIAIKCMKFANLPEWSCLRDEGTVRSSNRFISILLNGKLRVHHVLIEHSSFNEFE